MENKMEGSKSILREFFTGDLIEWVIAVILGIAFTQIQLFFAFKRVNMTVFLYVLTIIVFIINLMVSFFIVQEARQRYEAR